ncbi:MAG TPA: hypothetical protein VFE51_12530 [Verrucomicrobiae bacterium]|nr:hypothetical protein [Verrucomicrobiae bacterium]
MKAQPSNESDQALSRVLHEWKVQTPLPPRFEEGVWLGIARRQARRPAWRLIWERLGAAIARPALATSYLAVLLLAGLVVGYWQARAANARAEAQLSARYVQVVDPYQMLHH